MDGSRGCHLLFSLANIFGKLQPGADASEPSARCLAPPQEATVRRGESEATVPVEEVRLEETLIIYPGAKIPLDGEVFEGNSTVNQAPITGESMPVRKGPGDTVFAGSINQRGSLAVRVSHLAGDTTLARIIHMVEEARRRRLLRKASWIGSPNTIPPQ